MSLPGGEPRPADGVGVDGPIFVLGITGRSGSTYLLELISLHPDCVEQGRLEDFYLDESGPLFRFRDRLAYRWRWMEDGPELAARVAPAIGSALVDVLADGARGRLVTKTPSVKNLDRFFDLFPTGSLVVLVRDPRSVVASVIASWNRDGDAWARQWARRAQTIIDFDERNRDRGLPYTIVRYEDLLTDPRRTVEGLFDTLDLDVDTYDFDALADLPVFGSSEGSVDGRLSRTPMPRPADFAPLKRWEHWPPDRLARIEWITGTGLDAFGYERAAPVQSGVALGQRLRSAILWVRLAAFQARRRIRRARRIASSAAPSRGAD